LSKNGTNQRAINLWKIKLMPMVFFGINYGDFEFSGVPKQIKYMSMVPNVVFLVFSLETKLFWGI